MTPATAPSLSVVVVSHDTGAVIGDCLAALPAAARAHPHEVIVVDNASTDGTPDRLRAQWPQVRLVARADNAGFARGCNAGIAVARGRHVLLLNPDTVPSPGALDALVDFLDRTPRAGAAAPRLLDGERADQGTARAFPTPAALFFGRRSPLTRRFPGNRFSRRYLVGREHEGDEPFAVDWVSGACLMAPRRVIDEIGPLDPGFFMYWEDADWCRRAHAAGYEVFCVPEAEVVHDEGARRVGWPVRRIWSFHRSAYRYAAKHHLTGARRVLRAPVAALLLARAAVLALGAR